jgi:preprotein translocase subunit SecD
VGISVLAVLAVRAPLVATELSAGSELVYSVTGGSVDRTGQILQQRLRGLGLRSGSVALVDSGVAVRIPGLDPEEKELVRKTLEANGGLDFKLVVTKDQPDMRSEQAVMVAIEDILAKKRDGSFRPYIDDAESYDRYDVALDEQGKPVLVENKGVSGEFLKDTHRAVDSAGRPAVGFVWNAQGRNLFYDMTSNNVGRAMAIIVEGKVHSAPVIRSAIGEQGIIEGGAQGFSEADVKRLIVLCKTGKLPGKITLIQENKRPAEPGRATAQAAAVLVLGVMLIGGIVALTHAGQPTLREKA